MTEILAVFRSRTQAVECKAMLCARGVAATVVATPTELKLGCGFSVKFPSAMVGAAKTSIARANFTAFYGYFAVTPSYGGYRIKKL